MFTNKKDPLVDAVKSVMSEGNLKRQVEEAVNNHFGVSSRKAVPHEYLNEYDALLAEAYKCAMDEKVKMTKDDIAALANNPNEVDSGDLAALRRGEHKKKLNEKLTKDMSAGDVISDFVHSKDPKFKGKSKKERQKMALGAYYGMHREKSRKQMEESNSTIRTNKPVASDKPKSDKSNPTTGGNRPGKRIKESVESIMEEIRVNLEEQLMEAYATGDSEVFENFVLSLNEEQLELLGLNEVADFTDTAPEPVKPPQGYVPKVPEVNPSGVKGTSIVPDKSPSSIPTTTPPAAPGLAGMTGGRVAGTQLPDAAKPPQGYVPKGPEVNSSDVPGTTIVSNKQPAPIASRSAMDDATSRAAAGAQFKSPAPTPKTPIDRATAAAASGARFGQSAAPTAPAPAARTTQAPSSSRPTPDRPAAPTTARTQSSTGPQQSWSQQRASMGYTAKTAVSDSPRLTQAYANRMGSRPIAGNRVNDISSKWGNTFQESANIRESLESFIRNRFLKG